MNRMLSGLAFLLIAAAARADEPSLVLDVFPGKVPGETTRIDEEKYLDQKPGQTQVKRLTNVSKPTLSVFRPAKERDTGAAVVICPGGGYNLLAWDLEGEEVAAWLNKIGVTGIVLKYRVPRRPGQAKDQPPPGPQQDVQRALSLVRSKAAEWNLDPKRIGVLGFSAGGHLAAWAATNFDKRAYPAIDSTDEVSCRPDFAVIIYPGYLAAKDKDALIPDIRVRKDCPPAFFAHAADDRVKADSSILMHLALLRAGVPTELHVYVSGGHGYGLRDSKHAVTTWPDRAADWMRAMGFVK